MAKLPAKGAAGLLVDATWSVGFLISAWLERASILEKGLNRLSNAL